MTAITEVRPAAEDDLVLHAAHSEDRILLTEDKDFGALEYVGKLKSAGVVLIRFPAAAKSQLGQFTVSVVAEIGERLRGAFAVVEPGRVRISKPPAVS